MKNKLLSFMLAFVMVVGIMPIMNVRAEVTASGTCGDNLTWELDDGGTLTISGEGEMYDYERIYGKVTVPWFDNHLDINNVILENGITNIGKCAFNSCVNLTSITIPNSITIIGEHAFGECGGLTSIAIPNGVTHIGAYAFQACWGLTEITITDSVESIGEGAFASCSSLNAIVIPDSVINIGNSAFFGCQGLSSITIPDGITSIGNYMFYACDGLTSVVIPDSVTNIGVEAFYGSRLGTVIIPREVTDVGEGAFAHCSKLTSITIFGSVESIGKNAFNNCENLTDVYYYGTKEKWNEIAIGSYNEYLTNATIHCIEPMVEMSVLENTYFESADKTKFEIGFVADISFNHEDFKTLKFAFTDGEETTYMGYPVEDLGLPTITAEEGAEILLGIVLNNVPIKFKDNVTLMLTSEEME